MVGKNEKKKGFFYKALLGGASAVFHYAHVHARAHALAHILAVIE